MCLYFYAFSTQGHTSDQSYSNGGPKRRFEDGFNSTCSKYPFVAQHLANFEAPSQLFMIFVIYEAGVSNGGVISAIAYAIRTENPTNFC